MWLGRILLDGHLDSLSAHVRSLRGCYKHARAPAFTTQGIRCLLASWLRHEHAEGWWEQATPTFEPCARLQS